MKVMFVFGTRPEAIKLAPIILKMKKDPFFKCVVCVTGQHRQMLDQVLELFEIKPDYDLNLMKPNQSLSALTASLFTHLSEVVEKATPDVVVVQGDTTTAMVASLVAFYFKLKIAHVEAGLRSYQKHSPWPEEINRKITGTVADFHFAPTEISKQSLLKENVPANQIWVVGNSVIDALLYVSQLIDQTESLKSELAQKFSFLDSNKKMILVTGHRRESFGEGFDHICQAIREIAKDESVQIVYPVHLNPNVQEPVNRLLSGLNNVFLIEPQDYVPFIYLLKQCYLVLTDSGGVQEEAPSLGKPVLVMREVTERSEGVLAGTARLVGTHVNKIVENVKELLGNKETYIRMSHAHNPFGDGTTSEQILKILKR